MNGALAIYMLWLMPVPPAVALLTYAAMVAERRLGYLAPDAHKPGRPLVPKSGGVALLVFFAGLAVAACLSGLRYVCIYSATVAVTGLLGLIDDLVGIGAVKKVGVFALPALIPVVLHAYVCRPYVPVINGTLRLTILYPILFIIGYTVSANALNMADTHNGTAPTVTLAILLSLLTGALVMRRVAPLPGSMLFLLICIAALASYLPFNAYPAKVFNGNCGSFLMGGVLASAMVTCREEFLYLLLMMPLVLNSFSILSSIRGFKSKESIPARPVNLDSRWRLRANKDGRAPVTLVQLLVLRKPLNEKAVVTAYALLVAASCVTTLLVYYALLHLRI